MLKSFKQFLNEENKVMEKYLIADLHISIDCYDDDNLIATHKSYECEFECPPDIRIHIKKSEFVHNV